MKGEEIFNKIMLAVQDGESEGCADLARSALEEGIEPLKIVDEGLSAGIRIVGEKFGCGEMFLPDLMMAVEAMKAGMEILQPELDKRKIRKKSRGTVMIGTVFGDIHDIGKSIVATMLEMNGYEVIDLGINISTETFVKKIRELNTDILGLSAMLATTMREQKEVIEAVKKEGLRDRVKILVGGAPVSEQWAEEIGADGYGANAEMAVQLVKRLAAE
ncbi:MAG: corrinoid protein [Spirochaetes bacterium]|nr:corrinoid protein [Spirochaetota bacterium]